MEDFIEDKDASYSVKIISRAKISPNSNSSKTFGLNLNVIEDGVERNKILKYKKSVSTAKKSSKSGFNYTQAGFWFEEFKIFRFITFSNSPHASSCTFMSQNIIPCKSIITKEQKNKKREEKKLEDLQKKVQT